MLIFFCILIEIILDTKSNICISVKHEFRIIIQSTSKIEAL